MWKLLHYTWNRTEIGTIVPTPILFSVNKPKFSFFQKLLLAYEFVLLLSVPYTSKLEEADASEVPVVGSTKQLICNADKHGFPGDVKAMRWYKDGERINEKKQKYQISGY